MSRKEVFEEWKKGMNEMSVGFLFYNKEIDGRLSLAHSVALDVNEEEDALQRISEAEQEEGFMHWSLSKEGREFFKENEKVIKEAMVKMILNES